MIGHSRKSYLEAITKLEPKDRDIETLAASCSMYGKVDYLRVHNVSMHKRGFEVLKALNSAKQL
jgi:dihydropteroate synthase